MSKSRGNVINPDDVRENFGADAVRLYICFMGPTDKDKPWATNGIDGVKRFLDRLWRLAVNDDGSLSALDQDLPADVEKLLHKTIKKVTDDIEILSYNTAISAMMIFVNELYKQNLRPKAALRTLSQLLMPLGPHIAEELWSRLGGEGLVSLAPWPTHDPAKTVDNTAVVGVQVNGKMRGTVELALDASEEEAVKAALAVASVATAVNGQPLKKIIYKAGKIVNLIA